MLPVPRLAKIVVTLILLAGIQAALNSGVVNNYFDRIVNLCCFSIMLAVSLNIINGYTGQFSIGHAGFYAVGAYTSAAFSVWIGMRYLGGIGPEWLGSSIVLLCGIVVGASASALAGFMVGLPCLRLRGDYLAIATLGFGEMIRVAIINIDAVGGPRGFTGIVTIAPFFWIGLFSVGTTWISRNLLNSRHGRALLAVRDDEIAASVLGIDVTRAKVFAFVLSSALAGCAGALYAHYDGYLQPGMFDFVKSIEIIIMVVLGGLGSTTGAVIAGIVLTILPESLRDFQDYRMIVYSGLLIVVMLVRPQGLFGTKEFSWSMFSRSGEVDSDTA